MKYILSFSLLIIIILSMSSCDDSLGVEKNVIEKIDTIDVPDNSSISFTLSAFDIKQNYHFPSEDGQDTNNVFSRKMATSEISLILDTVSVPNRLFGAVNIGLDTMITPPRLRQKDIYSNIIAYNFMLDSLNIEYGKINELWTSYYENTNMLTYNVKESFPGSYYRMKSCSKAMSYQIYNEMGTYFLSLSFYYGMADSLDMDTKILFFGDLEFKSK